MIHRARHLLGRALLGIVAGGAVGGCTESAQEPVSLDLQARGRPVDATLVDGTRLTLSRADLAFGPLYLCAGAQAGQSCDAALAQWSDAAVIDVLGEDPVTFGSLAGYSGRALSYMHDCGLVSLLTQEELLVLPAAEALDGRSVEIAGLAEAPAATTTVPFRLSLSLASSQATDRGQPVVRSSPGDFDVTIDASTTTLTVAFDAAEWLRGLDSSAFWQDTTCEEAGASLVCAGTVSQECATGDSTDCATLGQVCAPSRGCQEAVVLDDDSEAGRSVAQAITLSAGLELDVD